MFREALQGSYASSRGILSHDTEAVYYVELDCKGCGRLTLIADFPIIRYLGKAIVCSKDRFMWGVGWVF